MLGKFKDKFKSTPNMGNDEPQMGNFVPEGASAYITFPDIDPLKEYEITGTITIGREVGDILLDDANLSPRHCTLTLHDDVISIIDHSSEQGTFLNNKRLDAGKKYIMGEKDQLRLGDLYSSLNWSAPEEVEAVGEQTQIIRADILPEVEERQEKTGVTKLFGQLNESIEAEREVVPELPIKAKIKQDRNFDVEEVELDPKVLTQTKAAKFSKKKRQRVTHAKYETEEEVQTKPAHLFYRLVGIGIDIFICLSIMNIFYVFVDFNQFLSKVVELGGIYLNIPSLTDELGAYIPAAILKSVLEFEQLDIVLKFLVVFFLTRIATSLILGVSAGQFVIGLHSQGSFLFKRILGGIRELLAVPTMIWGDLPTFIAKRSLKEILTKTVVEYKNHILSISLSVLGLVFFFLVASLSPMIKGLEILPAIAVKDKRQKIEIWSYDRKLSFDLLKMSLEGSNDFSILPAFAVEQSKDKRFLTFGVHYLDKKSGQSISIRKIKEFETDSLYEDFFKFNFLGEKQYASLYAEIHSVGKKNKNFAQSLLFSKQAQENAIDIVKSSFDLNLRKVPKYIEKHGPFVGGARDLYEKLTHLVSDKINSISLISLGGQQGFLFEHKIADQAYYSFISASGKKGVLYRLGHDPTDPNYRLLTQSIKLENSKDNISSRDPVELFLQSFKDKDSEDFEVAQLIYERYFILAKELLQNNNDTAINGLSLNLDKTLEVLKMNEHRYIKLMLNLTELNQHLKNKNLNYFQLSQSKAI